MTIRIAVRLPDYLVSFVDDHTDESRAAVVSRALERERRHELAVRDLAILAADADDGLTGLAEYAARIPRPDLD